jgi:hypothetical protein
MRRAQRRMQLVHRRDEANWYTWPEMEMEMKLSLIKRSSGPSAKAKLPVVPCAVHSWIMKSNAEY